MISVAAAQALAIAFRYRIGIRQTSGRVENGETLTGLLAALRPAALRGSF